MTTRSGYLNNPPRVVIIGGDNRPGSYPSHSSPIDIARSQGSDGLRPYRDDMQPASVSPYAKAEISFTLRPPAAGSSITLTSAGGVVSTFNFSDNPDTFNPSPGVYEISLSGITAPRSSDAIQSISQRFVSAVSRATGSQISAELSLKLGGVTLTQLIPGSNGTVTTTVSPARLSISNFSGGSSIQVRYPYAQLVDDSNPQTSELIRRVIKSERSGTLSAPGIPDPRKLIGPSDQHPYVNYSPFDETNSWQSFGVSGGSELYGTQTELYEDFFTRGSVSGTLDEPLSAKDKIVVDLTPTSTTVLRYTNTASIPTYGMAYYNFSQRKWEGVGTGYSSVDYAGNVLAAHDAVHAGFSPSCFTGFRPGVGAAESGWASCIDTFGFPVHPKYHATASQVLDTSTLIEHPFLVEKIVYEFSGSSGGSAQIKGDDPTASPSLPLINNCGATFFILNQRKANPDPGQDTSYTSFYWSNLNGDTHASPIWSGSPDDKPSLSYIYTSSLPTERSLSRGGAPVYVDSVRDLVTFARVGAIWNSYDSEIVQNLANEDDPHPAKYMDLAIEVLNSGTYNGHYQIASPVRAPEFNQVLGTYTLRNTGDRVFTSKSSFTRNSLDLPTGRAHNSEYCSSPPIRISTGRRSGDQVVEIHKEDSDVSPYLILPGDKLVFGWQSSLSFSIGYDGESFSIGPGKGKLILYGSYLRDNKPVHDIYRDQLISDSIHESIPSDPWSLDQFDTEPQMVYSGSLREEYVRGTMI